MAELKNAEIFTTGSHPGNGPGAKRTWTETDLDGIVSVFDVAQQAGRVPLKFGHNEEQAVTDGQPALGWVSRVWRQGNKLMANFVDMPSVVLDAIKRGLYKFVSVELLTNAKQGDATFPYMLDAVALLGADPPAVSNLADLQRLTAARAMPAIQFSTRLAFTRQFIEPDEQLPAADTARRAAEARRLQGNPELLAAQAENERLKTELATFKRANVDEAQREHGAALVAELEREVRAGHILPATRDRLIKLKRLNEPAEAMKFSREDLQLYMRSQDQTELLRGLTRGVCAYSRDPKSSALHGQEQPFDQDEVVKRIFARAKADGVDVFEALNMELAHDPDLGQAILSATFE
jgi:hypothetical protein